MVKSPSVATIWCILKKIQFLAIRIPIIHTGIKYQDVLMDCSVFIVKSCFLMFFQMSRIFDYDR